MIPLRTGGFLLDSAWDSGGGL